MTAWLPRFASGGLALVWLAAAPVSAQDAAPLTLADALRLARASGAAVAAAQARAEGARDAARVSGRWPNPMAEVRAENWASGAPDGVLLPDRFFVVTQPIELGRKRAARRAIAGAAVDEAGAAEAQAVADTDLRVARQYVEALTARDRARVLTTQAEGLAELVRVMARRVDAGTAPEGDLRKLDVELARVELDLSAAALDAARGGARLEAWLGDGRPVALDALRWPAPPPLPPADALDAGIALRPDVRAARARAAAADEAARLERARAIPDLHVSGGVKRTAGYDTGVIAVTLPVPLFDRNHAAVAMSRGEARAAQLDVAFVERLARAEARVARDAAARLAADAGTLDTRLLGPARIARDAARAAFREGAGDLLRLVDAERAYADAEDAALGRRHDALLAALEARRAFGEDLVP